MKDKVIDLDELERTNLGKTVRPEDWIALLAYARALSASAQQDERESFYGGTDDEVCRAFNEGFAAGEAAGMRKAASAQQVQADAGTVAWIAEHENDELDFVNFHEEVARQQAEESGALRVRPLVYGDAYTRPAAESDKRNDVAVSHTGKEKS